MKTAGAAALGVMTLCGSAAGSTNDWLTSSGGVFSDPAAWSDGRPGADDDLLFDVGGAYAIMLDADEVVRSVETRDDDVTFALGGFDLTLGGAEPIRGYGGVGTSGSFTFRSGLFRTPNAMDIRLGRAPSSPGEAGFLVALQENSGWTAPGTLRLGDASGGAIMRTEARVQSGSLLRVEGDLELGDVDRVDAGRVSVSGARLEVAGETRLFTGPEGIGGLFAQSGGELALGDLSMREARLGDGFPPDRAVVQALGAGSRIGAGAIVGDGAIEAALGGVIEASSLDLTAAYDSSLPFPASLVRRAQVRAIGAGSAIDVDGAMVVRLLGEGTSADNARIAALDGGVIRAGSVLLDGERRTSFGLSDFMLMNIDPGSLIESDGIFETRGRVLVRNSGVIRSDGFIVGPATRSGFGLVESPTVRIMGEVGGPFASGTVFDGGASSASVSAAISRSGATIRNGAVVTLEGGALIGGISVGDGVLGGQGRVTGDFQSTLGSLSVSGEGRLAPGFSDRAGVISADVDIFQVQGVLEIGLFGSPGDSRMLSNDMVRDAFQVSLAGTLELTLENGFVPRAGDEFSVLEYEFNPAPDVNVFSALVAPDLPGNAPGEADWAVEYLEDRVVVRALVPSAGSGVALAFGSALLAMRGRRGRGGRPASRGCRTGA